MRGYRTLKWWWWWWCDEFSLMPMHESKMCFTSNGKRLEKLHVRPCEFLIRIVTMSEYNNNRLTDFCLSPISAQPTLPFLWITRIYRDVKYIIYLLIYYHVFVVKLITSVFTLFYVSTRIKTLLSNSFLVLSRNLDVHFCAINVPWA